MIETSEQLKQFLDSAAAKHGGAPCAVDTEADSLHRYTESLCLIQFAIGKDIELIDPLAVEDLSPLMSFLQGRIVWMHGADYDMTMFKREFKDIPDVVYDTQIGARLLGIRQFGLGNLVEHYFDIKLAKTSQKADWGKRPLSEKMVTYALDDVRYLIEMGETIIVKLRELGRFEWFLESCEDARTKVLTRSGEREDPWRISGSGKLSPKGLALLRALWYWRDGEAKAWDRPTFMVCGNKQLISWCLELLEGKTPKLPGHYRQGRRQRFAEALAEARSLSEQEWPQRIKGQRTRRPTDFDNKLDALMSRRNQAAQKLDIDPSLIASRAALEALAGAQQDGAEMLLNWQKKLLKLEL
ncbi:MAG: ribonuclease D [Luteolibacter sp.]